MFNDSVIEGLKKHFPDIHPLVFHRSIERAKNESDLFDILDSMPKPPIVWSDEQHCWIQIGDIYLSTEFKEKLSNLKEDKNDG